VLIDAKGVRDLGANPNALRSHKVADFNPALVSELRVEAQGRTFHVARVAAVVPAVSDWYTFSAGLPPDP